MLKTRTKAGVAILITVFSMIIFYVSSLLAAEPSQSSDKDSNQTLLSKITDNTYWTWYYFYEFYTSWLSPDDEDSTATMQADFTNYMNYTWTNLEQQMNLQNGLLSNFFGKTPPKNVNDLSYTTVLGAPYNGDTSNLQTNINNYVINTAALNITHTPPDGPGWSGTDANKTNYRNFYNSINAIQTFGAYILSDFIANYQNASGNPLALSKLQETLKDEASSPDWFTQVSSENLGLVLRQILMFQSQIYLLMLQMVETQKQQLAISAMSNSLVVLGNQFNESQLLGKATGTAVQ